MQAVHTWIGRVLKVQGPEKWVSHWFPALLVGLLSWLSFMLIGNTPVLRAAGLAFVLVGMTMALRRYGAVLAVTGALALAFSPAFWSQTGGADSLNLGLTLLVLGIAGGVGLVLIRFSNQLYLGVAAAFFIFAVLFWSQLAQPGSLRLTTLSTAWLMYVLVDVLHRTNPRQDEAPAVILPARHYFALLTLLAVGVINDPLFVLIAPALVLGLFLSRAALPWWYWAALLALVLYGSYGLANEYVNSTWWRYPAAQAEALNLTLPYMMADGWREASRWIYMIELVVQQFTVIGVGVSILGVSRLSRWYAPLGVVTMVAYATYGVFGLMYFGRDSAVLLLPLLMVQVLWMTYAVHAVGQWLQGLSQNAALRWIASAVYMALPVFLLLRILGSV